MHSSFPFHQSSGDPRGRVQRRTDRYDQSDTRGQYPRPRDNSFAQPRVAPRQPTPPVSQPPAPRESAPREPEPQRDVYTQDGAQYQKPARPYVPGYMKPAQQAPQPQAAPPIRQEEYIAKQNPYVVVSETNRESAPRISRRVLITLVAAAVAVLAGVLTLKLVFTAQTEAVFAARAAAEGNILQNHPYGYRELIEREAVQNNLHPAFVAAIVLNESSFNPAAESYRGARGLMQMMPDTAQWVYDSLGTGADFSFDWMYDADTNVEYGCWYLNYLSGKFGGDPVLVAAAFHAGPTTVQNWLSNEEYSSDQRTIALENMYDGNTKAYVEKVMNAFAAYRRLYYEEVTV